MQQKINNSYNYDKAWKWVFTNFLKDGIKFIHPNLLADINWNIKWTLHEQELANIAKTNNKLYTKGDILIECTTIDKNKIYILLHFELDQTNPKEIAEKMYNYIMNLLYIYPKNEVHPLLVYFGNEVCNNINIYKYKHLGTKIKCKFSYFNLAEHSTEDLLEKNNLFAICFWFTKMIQEKKKSNTDDFKIIKECLEYILTRNKSKVNFNNFINFVELIIPESERQKLEEIIIKFKK